MFTDKTSQYDIVLDSSCVSCDLLAIHLIGQYSPRDVCDTDMTSQYDTAVFQLSLLISLLVKIVLFIVTNNKIHV